MTKFVIKRKKRVIRVAKKPPPPPTREEIAGAIEYALLSYGAKISEEIHHRANKLADTTDFHELQRILPQRLMWEIAQAISNVSVEMLPGFIDDQIR